MHIQRGDIVKADINIMVQGSIQGGIRPVVVVSNNKANKYSPVITIVPLSTKTGKKRYLPTHVEVPAFLCVGLPKDSIALCEQVTAINTDKIVEVMGKIDKDVMRQIAEALQVQIGVFEERRTLM